MSFSSIIFNDNCTSLYLPTLPTPPTLPSIHESNKDTVKSEDNPGVWPFAVLGKGGDNEVVLRDVANRIDNISDKTEQPNLAASTAILAGLILDKRLIQRILREDIMKESVIYQEITASAKLEGRLLQVFLQAVLQV